MIIHDVKIIDCFLFYNELDLLELRLRELYDHVDQFVVIESDHTLTNRPKPFYFEAYQARYQPWADKIRHVKHASSVDANPWINVTNQRNAIDQLLHCLDDNDVVILNDADEILRASSIEIMKQRNEMLFGIHMPVFNFRFNFMRVHPEPYNIWTTAARVGWLKMFGGQMLRNQLENVTRLPWTFGHHGQTYVLESQHVHIIDHGGWHFSYLGDTSWVIDKIQNSVHQEDNDPRIINRIDVERSLAMKRTWNTSLPYQYEVVDLDDYFPANCRLFPQYCLPNSGHRAVDFLPNHAT